MSFSCKIILAQHEKLNGERMVYLRATIDRQIVRVPVGFYLHEHHFDKRYSRVKDSHPNADTFNTELQLVITKANAIASSFRIKNKKLTVGIFREEFINPTEDVDLIGYMKQELALRAPQLQPNTIKQHQGVINKLERFQRRISFSEISSSLIQRFKNQLISSGNMASTADKLLKIVKQYLADAKKKGYEFEDPFIMIRIKNYRSNRLALTEAEVNRLDAYYESKDCDPSHKKLLRYFLFSCYTGLRISDISVITWNNVHDDMLIYVPTKTKNLNRQVTVPLTREKKYLPAFKPGSEPIFDTFSDPVTNRYLKQVAEAAGIKKNITYHTARHTFGSMMAEGGFLPETQKMMGHGSIKTTMDYVHTSNKNLVDAKKRRFSE